MKKPKLNLKVGNIYVALQKGNKPIQLEHIESILKHLVENEKEAVMRSMLCLLTDNCVAIDKEQERRIKIGELISKYLEK